MIRLGNAAHAERVTRWVWVSHPWAQLVFKFKPQTFSHSDWMVRQSFHTPMSLYSGVYPEPASILPDRKQPERIPIRSVMDLRPSRLA